MTTEQAATALMNLGFRLERITESGSIYFVNHNADVKVRVSEHEVPYTAEREANGSSWMYGWNVLCGDDFEHRDAARELVHIRRDVRRRIKLMS
jgi:hypothetical protein